MLISFQFQPPYQMRIQKTLSRNDRYSTFFRIPNSNYTVCTDFTDKLSGGVLNDQLIARFTLATKNPKEKGFKKVILDSLSQNAFLGDEIFQIIWKQLNLLKINGITGKQTVWMKVELA